MILCLTGLCCIGKTTVSKYLVEEKKYILLSIRKISHDLAVKYGYTRTRDLLKEISIEKYLLECRKIVMLNISDQHDFVIDDLFDIELWSEINSKYISLLIAFDLPRKIRIERMQNRENLSYMEAEIELDFLDGWKKKFGIEDVIKASDINIDVSNLESRMIMDFVCQKIRKAEKNSMENLFITELQEYKNTVECALNSNIIYRKEYPAFMEKYISSFLKYSHGGKRIRAYLVKLGYEMCGNNYNDKIILPSLSYEFFQTGVLIHDDIIDESTTRRNMPSMHVAFGNNHTAVSKAICVGDMGIIVSLEMIAKSDFKKDLIQKAVEHQAKVFELTIAGELKDIGLSESDSYSFEDVIEMYMLKTSWYTIAGPLQLGAILGGCEEKLLLQIEDVGMLIGVAFQIKDDILGVFGNQETIGKSNLSDMREGKKTILTRHFMDNSSEIEKNEFFLIYGNEMSGADELLKLQNLFHKTNSYEYANELCGEYVRKAKKIISEMKINNRCRNILFDFLDYLQNRVY